MSRALASPCVGQSSPASPSPVLPLAGEKGRSSTRLAEEGLLATSLFPCCRFTSPSAKPPRLAPAQPALPQARLAVPKGSLSTPGCCAQLWGWRGQRGLVDRSVHTPGPHGAAFGMRGH